LKQGRIDAARTVGEAETPTARVLWRDTFVALLPPRHRLAQRGRSSITLHDLDGEALVLRSICEMKTGALRSAFLSIHVAARAVRDDLALRLIVQGVGVAIAPRSLATDEVVAMPVQGLELERSIGLRWRAQCPEMLRAPVFEVFRALPCVAVQATLRNQTCI